MASHEETHSRAAQQGRDPTASDAQSGEPHDHGRMGMRGVTRPMAERQFHQQGAKTEPPHDTSHDEHGGGHHMAPQQRHHMLHMHHQQTLWILGQFMVQARRRGAPFWKIFWKGGTVAGGGSDDRSPELITLPQQPWTVFKASIWV